MEITKKNERHSSAFLIVLENELMHIYNLDERTNWLVGRSDISSAENPEISCSSRIVSRKHGWFRDMDSQWFYVDNPENLNGTFYNGTKLPRPLSGLKRPVLLENGDVLRISDTQSAGGQEVVMLFTTIPVKRVINDSALDQKKNIFMHTKNKRFF